MDLNKVLQGLNTSGVSSGLLGGMLGGAVSGALMSKKGRKTLGSAAKIGGLAALGGLAWKAYQQYQQTPAAVISEPATSDTAPLGQSTAADARYWQGLQESGFAVDEQPDTTESRGVLLIRAMIAAAHADGHISPHEQKAILERAAQLQLGSEERAMILDELRHPRNIEAIAAEVRDPETAAEVYLASAMAADTDCEKGQAYLNALAFMLSLPPALADRLQQQLHESMAPTEA